MQQMIDEMFMRRCLTLARNGHQGAKPNPMVGAVIVSKDGRIIGEGFHAHCGQGHAEVNAFASVKPEDEPLLPESTIYVSLEPCSHYGKTPPCADLIIRKGVRRVVCGCIDPFSKVQGRGVQRLRDAGIEVTVGVLEEECKRLNRRFFVCNTLNRPYIILKWAQSADRKVSRSTGEPVMLSTPLTQMIVHRLRAEVDAVVVGHHTLLTDHPQLTVRHWAGPNPLRCVLGHDVDAPEGFQAFNSPSALLQHMTDNHLQSLLVEGGPHTLSSFIDAGLWDELRIETSPVIIGDGIDAPALPSGVKRASLQQVDGNLIEHYDRQNL